MQPKPQRLSVHLETRQHQAPARCIEAAGDTEVAVAVVAEAEVAAALVDAVVDAAASTVASWTTPALDASHQ